jgi:hypothetical protein
LIKILLTGVNVFLTWFGDWLRFRGRVFLWPMDFAGHLGRSRSTMTKFFLSHAHSHYLMFIRFSRCLAVVLLGLAARTGFVSTVSAQALDLPRESITVAGCPAFIMLPTAEHRATPQPWIFYAPTLPGYPDEAERWMHERFLEAGIAVAGVDVGEAYGSPERSHPAFTALYDELLSKRGFAAKPCLLGRSRGGLWASSWALAHPGKVAGLAGIYPVFDLRSYPKLEVAAPAYGLTPDELERRLDEFNPVVRLGQLAKAGIPAALISGDEDTVVPLEKNSAETVRFPVDVRANKAVSPQHVLDKISRVATIR